MRLIKNVYVQVALLSVLILSLMSAVSSFWPFGDNTYIMVDLRGQYVGFFEYYSGLFEGRHTFPYTFTSLQGTEMYSVFMYYLMSPFNLLFLIFKGDLVYEGVMVMWWLKTITIAFSATYYLSKKSDNRLLVIILSLAYAFCGYVLAYKLNIMWLDALYVLPVLTYTIDRGIDERKWGWYLVVLSYGILVNFYTGYMLCLYAGLYYFYYKGVKGKGFFDGIIGFSVHSVLAGVFNLGVLLPSYLLLSGSSVENYSGLIVKDFDIGNFLTYIFTPMNDPMEIVTGSANVYMTVFVFSLLLMTLLTSKKGKGLYWVLGIYSLFIVSFVINQVNLVWHMFMMPAWFPNRFIFVYVWFSLVYIVNNFDIKKVGGRHIDITFIVLFVLYLLGFNSMVVIFKVIVPVFLGVYYLLMRFSKNMVIISMLVVLELSVFGLVGISSIRGDAIGDFRDFRDTVEVLPEGKRVVYDTKFLNGHFTSDYYSSTFSSTATTDSVIKLYKLLGTSGTDSLTMSNGYNKVFNMFMNIDLVRVSDFSISRIQHKQLEEGVILYTKLDDGLYENDLLIGDGHLRDSIITNKYSSFHNLNHYLGQYFEEKFNVWEEFRLEDRLSLNNMALVEYNNMRVYKSTGKGGDEGLEVDLEDIQGGYLYSDDSSSLSTRYFKGVDGVTYPASDYQGVVYITGDVSKYYIDFDRTNSSDMGLKLKELKGYRLDEGLLQSKVREFKEEHTGEVVVTKKDNTVIEGKFNNPKGKTILQLQIPYDSNFKAYIDGVETETYNSGHLLALNTKGDTGGKFSLIYEIPYLEETWLCAILTMVVVGGYYMAKQLGDVKDDRKSN